VSRTQLVPPPPEVAAPPGAEIRPAGAADCEPIKSFLAGLSDRSRYLRFFTPAAPPSSSVLRGMCATGPATDALVATENGVVIGHAMAVDLAGPDGVPVADIGLVVTDRWQNRGLGSRLLAAVVARAAARGARELVLEVLPENRRMLAMISRRWADVAYRFGGDSVTVRVRLPDEAAPRAREEDAALQAA